MRVAPTIDIEHMSRPAGPGCLDRRLTVPAGVRATCLFRGRWAAAHPRLARHIAAEGPPVPT